jgi:hypothetical protein
VVNEDIVDDKPKDDSSKTNQTESINQRMSDPIEEG